MAVTASGLYGATFMAALGTTQLALDLDLDTHKGALFNNNITPDFDSGTAAYGVTPYNTPGNEVFGTGWAAGGVALTGTVLSQITGGIKFTAATVSVASTTLVNARCYLLYAFPLAGAKAIVLVNFGADYSTNNGTLQITWDALGIFTIDLTPGP